MIIIQRESIKSKTRANYLFLLLIKNATKEKITIIGGFTSNVNAAKGSYLRSPFAYIEDDRRPPPSGSNFSSPQFIPFKISR